MSTKFSSQETRRISLSYGVDILTDDYLVLSQSTCTTGRRTDKRTTVALTTLDAAKMAYLYVCNLLSDNLVLNLGRTRACDHGFNKTLSDKDW